MTSPRGNEWLGIELRHLIALRAVAEERSFHQAAVRLGYSQSAISQQIAALERIVGHALVERQRGARPISLTLAGEWLLRHATNIEESLAAAKGDLEAIGAGRAGPLRVGSFQTIGARVLPEVLKRFMERWPEASIELMETVGDSELADAVSRAELDLAYVTLPPAGDGDATALEMTELLRDPLVVVADPGAGLIGGRSSLSAEDLGTVPLVCFQTCRATEAVFRRVRTSGFEPRVLLRSDDNEVLKGIVGAGVCAALLPRLALDPDERNLEVAALPPEFDPRVVALVQRADRYSTPAMVDFVQTSVRVCADLVNDTVVPHTGRLAG
jgi:DNA-binding transcriptional LysR family regulator